MGNYIKTFETFVPKNVEKRLENYFTGYLTIAYYRMPYAYWSKTAKNAEEAIEAVKKDATRDLRVREEVLDPNTKFFVFPVESPYFTLYWNMLSEDTDCFVEFYKDQLDYTSRSPSDDYPKVEINGKNYNHFSSEMFNVHIV